MICPGGVRTNYFLYSRVRQTQRCCGCRAPGPRSDEDESAAVADISQYIPCLKACAWHMRVRACRCSMHACMHAVLRCHEVITCASASTTCTCATKCSPPLDTTRQHPGNKNQNAPPPPPPPPPTPHEKKTKNPPHPPLLPAAVRTQAIKGRAQEKVGFVHSHAQRLTCCLCWRR